MLGVVIRCFSASLHLAVLMNLPVCHTCPILQKRIQCLLIVCNRINSFAIFEMIVLPGHSLAFYPLPFIIMFSMYSYVASEWIGLIGIIVRSADDFCVIVAIALACSSEEKGRYENGYWIAEVGFGLDVQEQLHSPVGQAQELPQLQVHPGPAPRDRGVS